MEGDNPAQAPALVNSPEKILDEIIVVDANSELGKQMTNFKETDLHLTQEFRKGRKRIKPADR